MQLPKLCNLRIAGDISIEPVTGRIPRDPDPGLYLIMGPTGAGKSSVSRSLLVALRYNEGECFDMLLKFIEALAGELQQLSISKDQLAAYTQTVNAYHVVNLNRHGSPVYLVDTPGFSDAKISEIEIMDMVTKWMKDNGLLFFDAILYLIPISETRLPGSRRRTMDMLKKFLAPNRDLGSVRFVTTMWDTLHNERTQTRAEHNFTQLRDQVLKDFLGEHELFITRFMNTQESALEALDVDSPSLIDSFFEPLSSASPHLYHDLHERIESALQVRLMIDSDLAQPEAQVNTELRAILESNQKENHETLAKFIGQLINFGPVPFGFGPAAQHLRKRIIAQMNPEDPHYMEIFQQWAEEPEILKQPVPGPVHSMSAESLPLSSISSRNLALKDLPRRLLNAAKHRGSKWFKRTA